MIVVRREDVLPGGRYAGGRFAPPVPEGKARPRPAPSPRELRERAHQRIQDQGYLRAQRTPKENRALATADAMDRLVREFTPLLAGFAPDESPREQDIGLSAPVLPDAGQDVGPAGDPFVPRERAPASASGLEGPVDVAGRKKLFKLLMDLLEDGGRPPRRPPAGPNPERTPPGRPENETPAPAVPPKPDRPLARMPDRATEPLRDALRDDPAPSAHDEEGAKGPEIVLPDVSEVPDPDNMLLADEFERMPETGLVDPNRIRTLQNSVDDRFKSEKGPAGRRGLVDTVADLGSGRTKPEDIPPVLLFEFDGKIWTLDHRRVVAARLAGKPVSYRKAGPEVVARQFKGKNTTTTDGLSVTILKSRE